MAINSIIFGGVNSADYGIYISGEGVFNAPKRDVEMVAIPGRNGEFALDKGRFENIEVTYPAFNFEPDDYSTFAQNLADFRNAICALRGYQRLTDTFHPDEYRMATYIGGLEIKPIKYNTASEFTIVFDCKPQRWLTSGEDAVTMGVWGDTDTAEGAIATFTAEDGDGVKSLVADIVPIQSGTGDPSPNNVRPITGHTQAKVSRTGKNLCKLYEWTGTGATVQFSYTENGVTLNGTATQSTDIPSSGAVPQNGIFTLKAGTYKPSTDNENVGIQIVGLNPVEVLSRNGDAFTLASDRSVFARASVYAGKVYNNLTVHLQLEAGTTATSYEPYQGTTYTVSFSSAGTVYGGTVNIVSGELTVTHAKFKLSDCVNGSYVSGSKVFGFQFNSLGINTNRTASGVEGCISDMLSNYYTGSSISLGSIPNGSFCVNLTAMSSGNSTITLKDTNYTTVADVLTAYGDAEFVVPYSTPTTVQLTAQQVSLLIGTNNIWSDTGDVSVEYGRAPNVLVNPTLFESSPLLAVEGYGTIGFNGYEIELENNVVGEIVLADSVTTALTSFNVNYNTDLLDAGDDIIIGDIVVNAQIYLGISGAASSLTDSSNEFASVGTKNGDTYYITTTLPSFTRAKGTAYTYKANTVTVSGTDYSGNSSSATCLIRVWAYDDHIYISLQKTTVSGKFFYNTRSTTVNRIIGDSTMTTLGHPTYIDCDYGEAYKIENGAIISLNAYIDLGSDLPKLASGANEITYDNTVTELKIQPRWWKV